MLTRFPLAVLPTPLVPAQRLRTTLGCGPLLIKRDDLAGFGVAGNKTRALEYLLGDAVTRECNVLVTGGTPDSNYLAAAAMAARVAGMRCELMVPNPRPTPNLALAASTGAHVHPLDGDRDLVDGAAEQRAVELHETGQRPYATPRGGSTGLGAVGFARAAAELVEQAEEPPALVVLAVGSGASVAGLLAGLARAGVDWPVLGVSVSRPPEEIRVRVMELMRECAELVDGRCPSQPEIADGRGPGFAIASDSDRGAARLALYHEGLLLDDTYGAKTFAALLERLDDLDGPIIYWHTGGVVSAVKSLGAHE